MAFFGDALDDLTVDGVAATACLMVTQPSGPAPLGVQFGTRWTAEALGLDPDYLQDYDTLWSMGDPGSEDFDLGTYWGVTVPADAPTWPANTPVGFNPSHVYESAGDYDVTLTILNRPYGDDNLPQSRTAIAAGTVRTVHVTDWPGPTYYVDATDGSDSNDGLTPATALKTESAALALVTDGVRVLFKRGEQWIDGPDWSLKNLTGPVQFGAYGDAADPVPRFIQQRIDYVELPANFARPVKMIFSSVDDLRLTEFAFEGNGWADRREAIALYDGLNTTVLRLHLSDCGFNSFKYETSNLVADGCYFDAFGPSASTATATTSPGPGRCSTTSTTTTASSSSTSRWRPTGPRSTTARSCPASRPPTAAAS